MAYFGLTVSPNDNRQLAINANRPFFLSRNILERSNAIGLPRWNATGSLSDADISRAGYPAYCACDGLTSRATYIDPSLDTHFSGMSTATTLFLLFSPSAAYLGVPNHADALIIWIPNLLSLINNLITFQADISNASNFSVGLQSIAHFNPAAAGFHFGGIYSPNFDRNGRCFAWSLGNASNDTAVYEYFNIPFVRLRFDGPVGIFTSIQPQIQEIYLGPKTCLSRSPSMPMPNLARDYAPLIGEFASSGGTRSDLVYAESRTKPSIDWTSFALGAILDHDSGATIDNGEALRDQFRKARHGTRNFVFVPSPLLNPEIAPFYHIEKPAFAIKRPDGATTQASFTGNELSEQGPFIDDEQPDEALPIGYSFSPFDTAEALVVATPNDIDGHDYMTWSAWIRMLNVPTNTSGVIFQVSNGTLTPFSVNLLGSGGLWTTVELVITDGTTGSPGTGAIYTATLGHALTVISGWHHICVAYFRSPDGIVHARCEIDVDGVSQTVVLASGSNVTGAVMSSGYPFTIGAACPALSFGSVVGPCEIAEAAIVDVAFSHAQRLLWFWNNGTPRPLGMIEFSSGFSWWRGQLNPYDSGSLGNHGSLSGSLAYATDYP